MKVDDASDSVDWAGCVLFTLELYHVLTHLNVLCGFRMLPRKDLVRQRFYFLFDTLTIFASNFVYLGTLRWLAALQMIQHFSYFIFWDTAEFCRRVISWSSLDWSHSYAHRFDWTLILGTTFDLLCHLINAVLICFRLSTFEVIGAIYVCQFFFVIVLFNPKLAWSHPKDVPPWVRKRIDTLTEDVGIPRIVPTKEHQR